MIIAISPRLVQDEKTLEVRSALDINWTKFLEEAGFEVLVIPFGTNYLESILKDINGIILSGGGDISAVDNQPISRLRDEFEKKIIDFGRSKEIPVVGVCRGMQLLASLHGSEIFKVSNHVRREHLVHSCGPDFEKTEFMTNSYHNYGVSLPSGFELLAYTQDDNAVEAFADRKKRLYGIMWHPERQNKFSEVDLAFFRNIFKDKK